MWGQPPATPVFEATSIKPSAPGRVGSGMNVLPARIRITNSSLKFCVQMAWNLQDYQVSGAQGWIETSKYDIEAVAASPFKPGEYRAMLQSMLTERFGLVIHRETKDKAGYALVIGRNGPKLPPPTEDPNILFQPDCFRRHDFEGHERIDEAVGGSSVVNSEGACCRQYRDRGEFRRFPAVDARSVEPATPDQVRRAGATAAVRCSGRTVDLHRAAGKVGAEARRSKGSDRDHRDRPREPAVRKLSAECGSAKRRALLARQAAKNDDLPHGGIWYAGDFW